MPSMSAIFYPWIPVTHGYYASGTIVSAGDPAITVDGTTVSLDESGALTIGSATISLTNPSPTPAATEIFTVADQTFTPNPSVFPIDGITISADGPAATISGTVISLGQNGVLKNGSSTVSLLTPSNVYPSKTYTVANQTFMPNPSAFSRRYHHLSRRSGSHSQWNRRQLRSIRRAENRQLHFRSSPSTIRDSTHSFRHDSGSNDACANGSII